MINELGINKPFQKIKVKFIEDRSQYDYNIYRAIGPVIYTDMIYNIKDNNWNINNKNKDDLDKLGIPYEMYGSNVIIEPKYVEIIKEPTFLRKMKNKFKLNETKHTIFKVEVLIKTKADVNKVFVYNSIRGLTGVVVVTVRQNDYLDAQATDQHEYSLLHLKFMVSSTPEKDIHNIKKNALITNKIEGLLSFMPRMQTLKNVGEY